MLETNYWQTEFQLLKISSIDSSYTPWSTVGWSGITWLNFWASANSITLLPMSSALLISPQVDATFPANNLRASDGNTEDTPHYK